jgi:phenylacetate-CoA ligase
MLLESQYWPPAQLLEFQRSQLNQLLVHARENVPFYRDRLALLFRSDGSIDWDRWREVPITTKEDLRDRGDTMLARANPQGHGAITDSFTSGSTGIPVTLYKNDLFRIVSQVASIRTANWMKVDPLHPVADLGHLPADAKEKGLDFSVRPSLPSWFFPKAAPRYTIERTAAYSRILDLLIQNDVRRIHGMSNQLEMLANECLERGLQLSLTDAVCYGMEATPFQRELFSRVFGARTWGAYSSEEAGQIAAQSTPGGSYLIHAELVLVEVLDEEGLPCPPGTSGRVVVTPFYSTAQPLIRYSQADFASFAGPSPCGRTLPTLDIEIGRQIPILQFLGGAGSYVYFSHEAISEALNCKLYQIAQTAPLAIELRYVPKANTQADAERAIRLVHKSVPDTVTVSLRPMDSIPFTGRKLQRQVREFTP